MSLHDNPYRSPHESEEPQRPPPAFYPVEEWGQAQGDKTPYLPLRFYLILGLGAAVGWLALAVNYPRLWAAVSMLLAVLAFGLLTTKFVLGLQRPLWVWMLTPILGLGWLLFFWALLR